MTITSRKRVSYVLQPPTYPVPLLSLPGPSASLERLGRAKPLLVRSATSSSSKSDQGGRTLPHPRHRLGVSCLALDTSTILDGNTSPEGIFYSGGRDGMVVSWDLKLNMRKRTKRRATDSQCDGSGEGGGSARARNRWEYITGWADELCMSDEEEASASISQAADCAGNSVSGDVLGDVTLPATIRRKRILERLALTPYENQWELDIEYGDSLDSSSTLPPGTTFRQCTQAHEDWVNDLLLCNYNQTVVSASSDGTVKAWNPHSSPSSSPSLGEPSTIGFHADYVRCITHSREQRWVASGSFDRTIKLWDLSMPVSTTTTTRGKLEPITTLSLPDNHHYSVSPLATASATTSTTNPTSHSHSQSQSHSNSHTHSSSNTKSSIYALATDPFGHIIASGSPERVIRLWDPRTGKRTGKLVGHTDNIRAILVSDDCRYLLTGSADASIKLWSLVSQRCLHTFTHHTDSVWSLHSTHPSLLNFYSGDKSGMVCRLDVEAWCESVSDGECVLVCRDGGGESAQGVEQGGGGITKIVSLDDHFIWTASGQSNINRWRVPIPRSIRAAKYRKEKDTTSIIGSITSQSYPSPHPSRPSSISFEVPDLDPASPSHHELHRKHSSNPTTTHLGIPTSSLIKVTSPNDPFFPSYHLSNSYRPGSQLGGPASSMLTGRVGGIGRLGTGGRMGRLGGGAGGEARHGIGGGGGVGSGHLDTADVATLYSAASFLSIPHALTMAGIGPLNRTMFPGQNHQNYNAQSGRSPGEESERGGGEREPPTLFASHSFSSLKPPSSYLQTMITTRDSQDNHEHEHGTRDLQIRSDFSDLHHDPHDPCSDMHDILADLPILASDAVPYSKDPDHTIQGDTGLIRAVILNDRMHVLTVDTNWEIAVWDIVKGVCVGKFAGVGGMNGNESHEKGEEDEKDEGNGKEGKERGKDEGKDGGKETKDVKEAKSPRDALEAVRERVEGQGVTPKWASVDTKTGILVVHLNERCFEAEVYADDVGYGSEDGGSEEVKINLGKWVLRNLFIGFLREERRIRKGQLQSTTTGATTTATSAASSATMNVPSPTAESGFNQQIRSTTVVICSPTMIPALPPSVPLSLDPSEPPIMTPLIPLIPIQPQADDDDDDLATVIETPKRSRSRPRLRALSSSKGSIGGGGGGRPQVSVNVNMGPPGTPLASTTTMEQLLTPKKKMSGGTPVDDFSGWSGPIANNNTINTSNVTTNVSAVTPSTPEGVRPTTPNTGLMNKLRSFGGKISANRRPTTSDMVPALPSATMPTANTTASTTIVSTPTTATGGTDNRKNSSDDHKDLEKNAIQHILSGPLSPPPSTEAPNVAFPPNTLVMISEESSPHHLNVYRGTVENTHDDVKVLEQVIPTWLLAYLLQNRILSQSQPTKISFVLLPWASKDPEEETLPELLNTAQSKLTASRYLRVRKLVHHVHEKLDKVVSGRLSPGKNSSSSSSPTSLVFAPTTTMAPSATTNMALANLDDHPSSTKPKLKAEDVYEILCNDVLLPLDMTLAAVRQYVWKSSSELTMWYRLKDAAKRKIRQ